MSEKEYRHYCYKDGYTRALADVVAAVEAISATHDFAWGKTISKAAAIAAIMALGGK